MNWLRIYWSAGLFWYRFSQFFIFRQPLSFLLYICLFLFLFNLSFLFELFLFDCFHLCVLINEIFIFFHIVLIIGFIIFDFYSILFLFLTISLKLWKLTLYIIRAANSRSSAKNWRRNRLKWIIFFVSLLLSLNYFYFWLGFRTTFIFWVWLFQLANVLFCCVWYIFKLDTSFRCLNLFLFSFFLKISLHEHVISW
jgi:hypothetical protein